MRDRSSPVKQPFCRIFRFLIQQYKEFPSTHSKAGIMRSIHRIIPALISALSFKLQGCPHAVFAAMYLREDFQLLLLAAVSALLLQ